MIKKIIHYLRPYRVKSCLLLFFLMLPVAYSSFLSLSFKYIIDDAILGRDKKLLLAIVTALVAALIISTFAGLLRDYLYAQLGSNVLFDIRQDMYRHLQRLPMKFYSRTTTGNIMTRFSTDLSDVENVVVWMFPEIILSLFEILLSSSLIFILDWKLALLSMAGLVFCLFSSSPISSKVTSAEHELKRKQAEILDAMCENIGAQPLVKAYGLQNSMVAGFREKNRKLLKITTRSFFLTNLMERIPITSILFLELLVIIAGAFMVFNGQLQLGTFVSFQALLFGMSEAVCGLTYALPHLVQASVGLQRIEGLLNESSPIANDEGAKPTPQFSKNICFNNVTFGYTAKREALKRVSLDIQAGSSVAFVGPSGSGKSSIINMILRFYDPDQGAVSIDGHDLRKLRLDTLHSQFGVVFHDSFLFNTTIAENMRLSVPDATHEQMIAAAKAVGIHDEIMKFPDGYDTVVGERGSRLSAGQRQRLAIARAIMRNPPVLILDEATSSLDQESEAMILSTLKNMAPDRTIITMTHRLPSVVDMDYIYVLDGGQIVEQGRHKALLRLDGVYKRLWEKKYRPVSAEEDKEPELIEIRSHATFSAYRKPVENV